MKQDESTNMARRADAPSRSAPLLRYSIVSFLSFLFSLSLFFLLSFSSKNEESKSGRVFAGSRAARRNSSTDRNQVSLSTVAISR